MNESEGMHDPDWDRFKVTKDGTNAPVGDPTRWGAQIFTALADTAPDVYTPQILSMSTRDGYARPWSLLGTLSLPTVTWDKTQVGPGGLVVSLEISLGVGQIQITHSILLLTGAGTGPGGVPTVPGGLCFTQNWFLGGPYNTVQEAIGGVNTEARAFAVVGGLVGQSISIRARYQIVTPPTPGLPTTSRLGLIVTPYAAGEGL